MGANKTGMEKGGFFPITKGTMARQQGWQIHPNRRSALLLFQGLGHCVAL